ncbi:MAG: hypothetical protein ACU84Q_07780 [Gammaproteobacteria bacterium]
MRNHSANPNIAPTTHGVLGIVLLLFTLSASAVDPKVNISGFWELDEVASDDPESALKDIGKFDENKRRKRDSQGPKGDRPIGGDTYKRYWQHVAEDKEWQKVANAAHRGSIKSLVFNSRLAIAQTETGFKVWYQDGFVRDINPNPYGRVFSASGDELVANDLGRTLSYVKKDKIISETRTKPRGEILESFRTSPALDKLFVSIKVDRPDWNKIVELNQVYTRVSKNPVDQPEIPPGKKVTGNK